MAGQHTHQSIYDQLGEARFEQLLAAFYRRVAVDPVLRPLYPEPDLAPAERRLRLFLIQFFGGPATYSEERGHPRLRMRHEPFLIGEAERAAWMAAMLAAMDEVGIPEPIYGTLHEYFERAAAFMVNTSPLGGMLRSRE